MVKLRHIVGANLSVLEKTLESVKNSIIVIGVNNVGGNWFIHFFIQDTLSDNANLDLELRKIESPIEGGTKTLKGKGRNI
jgi:hypothetical protein